MKVSLYIYIYIIVYILCHMFVFEVYTKRMQKNYSWTKEAISMNCIYAYINIIIIHLYKGRKWLGGNSWLIGFLYVSWPSCSWASRLIRFATYIEKKKNVPYSENKICSTIICKNYIQISNIPSPPVCFTDIRHITNMYIYNERNDKHIQ